MKIPVKEPFTGIFIYNYDAVLIIPLSRDHPLP